MPQSAPHVLLPMRSNTGHVSAASAEPAFGAVVRWVLRLLSWLAFGVAGYLAWHAISQTSVAGCGVGNSNGCDVVLSSSWSKWLGIPVAVAGLACYSMLAALSVLLGVRNESVSRWINTLFVMLSVVAAGASLWFIAIQVFAIGDYCKFCLVTDACGILLGAIAVAASVSRVYSGRGAPQRTMQPGLMALRTAMPSATRGAPSTAYSNSTPPSLGIALGGALPLLALLIGGQILFAAKTYEVQKVELKDSIEMVGTEGKAPENSGESASGETRIAMRIPSEPDGQQPDAGSNDGKAPDASTDPGSKAAGATTTSRPSTKDSPPTPVEQPKRERLVKFLNGKLTLDVYKHPIIGSPEAPHIVVEMVSYDCPHCRKMHPLVQQAIARYGDQVAILVMPVPLDKDCNKLITDPTASHPGACATARMAVGIAKLNPRVFVKFHDFVMTGKDKPPAVERIIPKAYSLANRDRLREMIRGKEVDKQIEGYVDLYSQLQKQNSGKKEFGLPAQILGDHVISGEVEKADDLFKAWEENLGVAPK